MSVPEENEEKARQEKKETGSVRSLKSALQDAQRRIADQDDAVFDMQAAEHARLAMLANDLRPMMEEIDETDERFEFALTNGERPRLWIDMTSFLVMGQDRKTYRFLKDTRMGRIVLAETANMDKMADIVSDYVVDKVLERDRLMDGERESLRKSGPLKKDEETLKNKQSSKQVKSSSDDRRDNRQEPGGKFWWFFLGIVCCLILLVIGVSIWAPEAL